MPGSFLGGANARLLPASIPFRFFAAASIFHIAAWALLFAGAADLPGFIGGKSYVLAALHALTLGVLALSAIGASLQLLPVATRQSLIRTWPAVLCFWLVVAGTILLVLGMIPDMTATLTYGAGMVSVGLLLFAIVMFDNLRRAGSMPVEAAHGWAAMLALLVFVALGLALVSDFEVGFLADRQATALAHMGLAAFGFMGLLVLGFSRILIPMFVLSSALAPTPGWGQLGLAVVAIGLLVVGQMTPIELLTPFAALVALGAATVYLWQMRVALAGRMRKRLGPSFILIRSSWGFLALGLVVGLALSVGVALPNGSTLFGFLIIVGWLLTFLTGVLQRIMPFLASMHAAGAKGMPPLLSDLTPELPLRVHTFCHFLALAFCLGGILFDNSVAVQTGAGLGVIGALAFAGATAFIVTKLNGFRDGA